MASSSASVLPSFAISSSSLPARDTLSPSPWLAQRKSPPSRSLAFSPLSIKLAEKRRAVNIVAMATGDQSTSDPSQAVQDALKSIQETWDKTDDKLAVGGLGVTTLIVLWALSGLLSAIDKLPLIPNFFEFVGILFTGWFIYRYLLFKPDREELVKKIEDAYAKITGSKVDI